MTDIAVTFVLQNSDTIPARVKALPRQGEEVVLDGDTRARKVQRVRHRRKQPDGTVRVEVVLGP